MENKRERERTVRRLAAFFASPASGNRVDGDAEPMRDESTRQLHSRKKNPAPSDDYHKLAIHHPIHLSLRKLLILDS